MKKRSVQLLLSAALLSCVYLIACQKSSADPSLTSEASLNGRGHGHDDVVGGTVSGTTGGTYSGTCYLGQGYWFGGGKHTWADLNGTAAGNVTIGGFNYTQQQAQDIWKSSNSGGKKDAKKAFILVASVLLSGNNVPTYTGMSTDLATVQSWLSSLGQLTATNISSTKMPANVKAAYSRLNDWLENHECDDSDDREEVCTTDIQNWFGSGSQTWPDVNGTTAGNVTIAGFNYTPTEALAVYNFYLSSSNHDPEKVFLTLAALKLAQANISYTGYAADITTLETWLAGFNKLTATNLPTTTMPANVADAYSRLTGYVQSHDCDGSDEDDDD